MTISQAPEWRQFETAVANFLAAIGQGARVTHDVRLPDIHSGHSRQRDVWIEWLIAGHFPARALVSCKNWSSALDQSDIDHFNGEFISSGAQVGIIYAKNGFNQNAIQKSKILGFHCCRLYENQPADLPESLIFDAGYHFRPQFMLSIQDMSNSYQFRGWEEIFALPAESGTILSTFMTEMEKLQKWSEQKEILKMARAGVRILAIAKQDNRQTLKIELSIRYRAFQSRLACTMLNGSYNITAGLYHGSQCSPWIDMKSPHPGPGWSEIEAIPAELPARFVISVASIDIVAALHAFANNGLLNIEQESQHTAKYHIGGD